MVLKSIVNEVCAFFRDARASGWFWFWRQSARGGGGGGGGAKGRWSVCEALKGFAAVCLCRFRDFGDGSFGVRLDDELSFSGKHGQRSRVHSRSTITHHADSRRFRRHGAARARLWCSWFGGFWQGRHRARALQRAGKDFRVIRTNCPQTFALLLLFSSQTAP